MKDINDLRAALFKALDGLSDGSMDIERAKVIADVSQTIINTAKVEVDFIKATGKNSTVFIPQLDEAEDSSGHKRLTNTGVAIPTASGIVHRMR